MFKNIWILILLTNFIHLSPFNENSVPMVGVLKRWPRAILFACCCTLSLQTHFSQNWGIVHSDSQCFSSCLFYILHLTPYLRILARTGLVVLITTYWLKNLYFFFQYVTSKGWVISKCILNMAYINTVQADVMLKVTSIFSFNLFILTRYRIDSWRHWRLQTNYSHAFPMCFYAFLGCNSFE